MKATEIQKQRMKERYQKTKVEVLKKMKEHRDYSKPYNVSFVCAFCNKQLGGGLNAK